MHPSTKQRPKGFIALYAVFLALVAVSSGLAVFASFAPGAVTALTRGVDAQIALFMVPLAALMFAIIAEVLHATFRGATPAGSPERRVRTWKPGHGEG